VAGSCYHGNEHFGSIQWGTSRLAEELLDFHACQCSMKSAGQIYVSKNTIESSGWPITTELALFTSSWVPKPFNVAEQLNLVGTAPAWIREVRCSSHPRERSHVPPTTIPSTGLSIKSPIPTGTKLRSPFSCQKILILSHHHFLPHLVSFIIHSSSYHSASRGQSADERKK
jgi:hypothetical protein